MIRLLDRTKISIFNYFYLFCILIYAGRSTLFACGLGDITTFSNFVGVTLTLIFVFKNKIYFKKEYFISIIIFSIYAIMTFINNYRISPMWLSQWYIWLTVGYVICQGFKERLFIVYETLLYQLCIISLFLWLLLLISPDAMINFMEKVRFSEPLHEKSNAAYNIIVYTVSSEIFRTNEYSLLTRNCGFAWEPGAFSVFICLAIFCNSLRCNFKIIKNRALIVFIVTLFTTQSTTGGMILIAMLLGWLIVRRKFLYSFILIPLLIYMYQLPFIQEKLMTEYELSVNTDLSDYNQTSSYQLGRIKSFLMYMKEFQSHPILGLGGYKSGRMLNQEGYDNIVLVSGIGALFAMYGIVMAGIFFVSLYKSCRYIAKNISKNGYLLPIAVVGMMISYSLWQAPIYISFWMFAFYMGKRKNDCENILLHE